jgi:DNA polymerase
MNHLDIDGRKFDLVTLDFETFFAPKYTLRSMSTTDYIHDKRFKAHGVSVKFGEDEAQWYTDFQMRLVLRSIDWKNSAVLCHNTMFDGYILYEHFGVKNVGFWLDSLSMARAALGHHMRHDLDTVSKALGDDGKIEGELIKTSGIRELDAEQSAALGVYANNDVEKTYNVFKKLYDFIPDDELQLIDITLRMFCEPVLQVNRRRVKQEHTKHVTTKAWKVANVAATAKQLRSRIQFPKLLEAAGTLVPRKISKRTGQPTLALAKTDQGFKELLRHGSPAVKALCEAKLALSSTGGETRAQRFLTVTEKRRPLPVALNYSGAHTHRWSGGNKMNMQNLERGGELRQSILAPPGYVLVVADSAQIEARFVAWLADENDLLHAFRSDRDIYSEFASRIYGRTIDRKRKQIQANGQIIYPDFNEGFVGKTCILGLGYGMGPDRLRDTLLLGVNGPEIDMPRVECQKIIDLYRSKYWLIPELWKQMKFILECMAAGAAGTFKCIEYGKNFIKLPGGLFLQYPGLKLGDDGNYFYQSRTGPTKIYDGLLTENVVQALARRAVAEQMLVIAKKYRICLMTHDEIVLLARREDGKAAFEFAKQVMATTPKWAKGLPLKAEGGWSRNYSK